MMVASMLPWHPHEGLSASIGCEPQRSP